MLQEVWDHYITETGRNLKTYSFTPLRRRKGIARLQECLSKTSGDLENAKQLLIAIDKLVASDFHMGRDAKTGGRRYCEWEQHLFRSYEQMERWWNA